MKLDADDIYVAFHEGRINSSEEYYPASEYEALEAKLAALVDEFRLLRTELDMSASSARIRIGRIDAAIAAAKVTP